MKTESVTYEIVATKIKDLLLCGEKLTIRNVLNLTGGSSSKIMSYIKRWHDEQKLITQKAISEELLGAIAKEYAKVEAKTAEFYQNKVINLEGLLTNAIRCNAEYEEKLHQVAKVNEELATAKVEISSLEANLVSLNEENNLANNTIGKLEQKLSGHEHMLSESIAGCQQLRAELDEERALHKDSTLANAQLQTKYNELNLQMKAIIKQIGIK